MTPQQTQLICATAFLCTNLLCLAISSCAQTSRGAELTYYFTLSSGLIILWFIIRIWGPRILKYQERFQMPKRSPPSPNNHIESQQNA